MPELATGRRRRLAEELAEVGLPWSGDDALHEMLLEEIDRALRPPIHERRSPSSGTIAEPRSDPETWGPGSQLDITRKTIVHQPLPAARRFADGLSSWIIRRTDGTNDWLVFDRPAGSERDLVVLASVFEATIVQRHPAGPVRVVGSFGVLRWDGFGWHHEPPVRSWIDTLAACAVDGNAEVVEALLEFAVHDLGSLGIGALLVYRPDPTASPTVEELLPPPPALQIRRATHLGPLRHALAQIDGAAMFDADGVLRQLGVRLIPSAAAEQTVEAFGGTRHTSGRRYSRDDPRATVIAVSEDGPVSVLRNGKVLGHSHDGEHP
jgi:Probable sensor domain DACNK/DisA bacterial checkpoint controller nucleotide-binding